MGQGPATTVGPLLKELAVAERFTNQQIVEFVFAISTYMLNSRLAELERNQTCPG